MLKYKTIYVLLHYLIKFYMLRITVLILLSFTYSLCFTQKHQATKFESVFEKNANMGRQCFNAHDYNMALQHFLKAWEIDSNDIAVNIAIAENLLILKDYEEAIYWCNKNLHKKIKSIDLELIICAALQETGKQSQALEKLLELSNINAYKNNNKLWFYLGLGYYNEKKLSEAKTSLEKSIRLYSNFPEAHFLLARVMKDLNYPAQSLLCLYYFLFLDPLNQQAREVRLFIKDAIEINHLSKALIQSHFDSLSVENIKIEHKNFAQALKNNTSEDQQMIEIDNFKFLSQAFFDIMYKKFKDNTDMDNSLWIERYIPVFHSLIKTRNLTTFCIYISQSKDIYYTHWLETHPDEFRAFSKWISN